MEIAILVFFLAIFGGFIFLAGLIWLVFRRFGKSRPVNRNFSGNPNFNRQSPFAPDDRHHQHHLNSQDNANMTYAAGAMLENQNPGYQNSENQNWESAGSTATAQDSPYPTDNSYSHESAGMSADLSYTESSSSSYDSGSSASYDSGSSSSSDSGSSSSDSGSSSSSSD
jgi:hypothetical protein